MRPCLMSSISEEKNTVSVLSRFDMFVAIIWVFLV